MTVIFSFLFIIAEITASQKRVLPSQLLLSLKFVWFIFMLYNNKAASNETSACMSAVKPALSAANLLQFHSTASTVEVIYSCQQVNRNSLL